MTTAEVVKRVSPSVVVIQGKTGSSKVLGSGFIVSQNGKIVTNLHVITDMEAATVQMATGQSFERVSVLATDELHDLAIVQIAGFDLPILNLGNSDSLSVGEPVVVVGSPRGLEGTATAGILSSIRDSGEGYKVLQTDAAVNPGNSGGPLVNNQGRAIGVVSFKLRSSEGLNFAIPVSYVRRLLNNLHEPLTLGQMRKGLIPKPDHGADVDASETVSVGGVGLRLGMSKDSYLTIVTERSNLKTWEIEPSWYMLLVKTFGEWEEVGTLTFRSGKLTRISSTAYSSSDKPVKTFAKAFYGVIESTETSEILDVWTGKNDDVNNPMYEVHLVFRDREVVIRTMRMESRDLDTTSVEVYFPRVLAKPRTR